MNLTEEKIGPCLVALQVEVEPERMDRAMQQAARRIAGAGRIAGFRKGKAPYHVVLRTYGKEAVLEEAVDKLGNEILQEAVTQQSLTPYDKPSLEIVSQEPLKLKFTVPTKPVVDLGNYRALRLAPKSPEPVDEAQVNEALEKIRKNQATHAPVERPAQMGDMLRLDMKIDAGEKTLLDRKEADVELQEGDADVAPGFSAAMVGAAIGEKRNFDLKVPDDFVNEELRGQTLRAYTTVHDVKEVQLPPLDDELAKTIGKFDTLAEMRADLRQNLEENAARVEKDRYESETLKAAVEGAKIEFPDVMAEEEVRHSLNDLMRDVTAQGFTFENWLRLNNTTLDAMRANLRPGVEERLRNSLFLYNLAEREGIKIEAADIDGAVEEEAQKFPEDMQETVRQVYNRENSRVSLGLRLLHSRALDKLVSIARGEGVLLPSDAEGHRPSEVLVAH